MYKRQGCAVAMHKGVAKQIFLESGVDTPGGGTIYKNSEDRKIDVYKRQALQSESRQIHFSNSLILLKYAPFS